MQVEFLAEAEVNKAILKVVTALHGVPISQAHHVLTEAKRLIGLSHVVDSTSARFKEAAKEFSRSPKSNGAR